MKKISYIISLLMLLFVSCNDEAPILPGLSKSTIEIISYPANAVITINGKSFNKTTPCEFDDFEPGFYKVGLKLNNYLDTIAYCLVKRGEKAVIQLELRENPSYWWKVFNTTNSQLPTNSISKIAVDANGVKWIGTNGKGLVKFDGSTFNVINTSNSLLPDDYIKDIIVDGNNLWVATRNGIAKITNNSWLIFTRENSNLPDNVITSIIKDKKNNLWFGTNEGGVVKFDGVSFSVFSTNNSGLMSDKINTLAVDSNNVLWVGTWGYGISTYDGTTWRILDRNTSGLTSDYVSSIVVDQSNNVFVGTGISQSQGSVQQYLNNRFLTLPVSANNLSPKTITDIVIDNYKRIWVSSGDAGLFMYDNKRWIGYNILNSGLTTNSVLTFAIDINGDKWMAANGLCKYIGQK